jgi:hypothetical protein
MRPGYSHHTGLINYRGYNLPIKKKNHDSLTYNFTMYREWGFILHDGKTRKNIQQAGFPDGHPL